MNNWYLIAAIGGFAFSLVLTPLVMMLARRHGAIDDPDVAPERKRHGRPVALWGGLAVIASTLIVWWGLAWAGKLVNDVFPLRNLISLTIAGALIALGGALDDRRRLHPRWQFLWPLLATLVVAVAGIGVKVITNPFGPAFNFDLWPVTLWHWHGVAYSISMLAAVFAVVWMLGMTYTTKILDGLDGLVSGIGAIGAVIVFLLTLRPEVNQPSVALLALGLAGACLGFLVYNWHPAKVFLGESGSLYIGFVLGVISIISGGKIATALLIMGLPILDLAWVIIQRRWLRHTSPFMTADRLHLHFRLLDAGLSVRQTVILLYTVSLAFGLCTLWFRGVNKVLALGGLLVVMAALAWWVGRRSKRLDASRQT